MYGSFSTCAVRSISNTNVFLCFKSIFLQFTCATTVIVCTCRSLATALTEHRICYCSYCSRAATISSPYPLTLINTVISSVNWQNHSFSDHCSLTTRLLYAICCMQRSSQPTTHSCQAVIKTNASFVLMQTDCKHNRGSCMGQREFDRRI